jgi:hypothetical protein
MNETTWLNADVDIADVIRALAAAGAPTVPGILRDEVRRRLHRLDAVDREELIGLLAEALMRDAASTNAIAGAVARCPTPMPH